MSQPAKFISAVQWTSRKESGDWSVREHRNEDEARAMCRTALGTDQYATVGVYRLVAAGVSEQSIAFKEMS